VVLIMADAGTGLREFLVELKRRKVYRVAVVYAVVAFVIWQASEIAFPALHLPEWTLTFVVVLTLVGFPIALVLAWAFDITAEGVRRTEPRDGEEMVSPRRGWLPPAMAGLAVLALVLAAGWWMLREPGESPDERKTLVVLPFENLGPPEEEYFADGVTEEITSRLARISGLGVIGRTSAIQYKNTNKTIRGIGEELGVDYLLEGTVRWERVEEGESRVRVTPQLIKVSDATHVWTEPYEEALSGIFRLQADIAERVAAALEVTLLGAEREALEAEPTGDLEAYDYYLRGIDYYRRGFLEREIQLGIQMFGRAVELDSAFALAYAWLGFEHTGMHHLFYDRSAQRLAEARAALDEALRLDPGLPEAHLMFCFYYWTLLEHDRALDHCAVAQRSLPNESELWRFTGLIKMWQGEFEEALEYQRKAQSLDPRYAIHPMNVGGVLRWMRRHREAARSYERAIALLPDFGVLYVEQAYVYLAWDGTTERARAALARAPQAGASSGWLAPLLQVQLELFDRNYAGALEQLDGWERDYLDALHCFVPQAQLYAQTYGRMGDRELERAYYDSARAVVEARMGELPADPRLHSALGIAYAGLGRVGEAIREGRIGVELAPFDNDAAVGPYRILELAQIYTMVGEYDAAVEQLEFLLSVPGPHSAAMLRLDPTWDTLRDHPRFQSLLEEHR
jgi:TolB-like protein/Tfp pilus assembly protein PilF